MFIFLMFLGYFDRFLRLLIVFWDLGLMGVGCGIFVGLSLVRFGLSRVVFV